MKGITIYCVCIILVMSIDVGDCSPQPREKAGAGRADAQAKALHAPKEKSAGITGKVDTSAGKPKARCFGLDLLGLWPWGDDSDYSSDYSSDESDEKKKTDKGKSGRSDAAPQTKRKKSRMGI